MNTTAFDRSELRQILHQFEHVGPSIPDGIDSFCEAFESWIKTNPGDENQRLRFRADLRFVEGNLNTARGNYQLAIDHFYESIGISRTVGNIKRQIFGLCAVATCLEYAGMQIESSDSILEALRLAESVGDDATLVVVLHSLTALYQAQGAYEQMLSSAMRTLDVVERLGDQQQKLRIYSAISLACSHLDRTDEGFEWLTRARDLVDQATQPLAKTYLELNLMVLHRLSGRTSEAVALAEANVGLVSELPAQQAAALYVDMASIHLEAGDLDRASAMLELADQVCDPEWMTAHLLAYYQVASAIHDARDEPAKALELLHQCMQLEGELRGQQAQTRLVVLERHFAAELAAKTEEVHHLRTVELVEKNRQLSELLQQNAEILHFVVHDLRNPLAAARMLSDSLLVELGGDHGDAHELVESIRSATVEMSDGIAKLLEAQEALGKGERALVGEIVRSAVEDLVTRATALDVAITTSIGAASTRADKALLRRAIRDVLASAIETGTPGQIIELTVAETEHGTEITILNRGARSGEFVRIEEGLYTLPDD